MNNTARKKGFFNSLSKTQKWLLLLGIPLITYPILPVVIVLFIGLLPTTTILITDIKNSEKLVVVGCFNFAGVFIYIMHTINNYSISGAFDILSSVFCLIIMLGSAAIGLLLYLELPTVFLITSKYMRSKKLTHIETKLAKLEENWGKDITQPQTSTETKPKKTKKSLPKAS